MLSGIDALVTVLLIADDDPDGWTTAEDEEAPGPYEWMEDTPVPDCLGVVAEIALL